MERKPLLSVTHEFLGALPGIFKHRPVQLIFTGIGIILISATISSYYNLPQWILLISIFIAMAFFFLGFIDWEAEETEERETVEEEEDEYKEIMQKFKIIEKELRGIKNRLEKIEEMIR